MAPRDLRTALGALVGAAAAVTLLALGAPDTAGSVADRLVAPVRALVGAAELPTPRQAAATAPLGAPARLAAGGGPHRFTATQPGSDEPVAFDPCRPVRYVVNDRTAPTDGEALLAAALREISAATGLVFLPEGATDEPATTPRPPFQPDRYGDRWAPVLVSWSDPAEQPALAGDVLGRAGSVHVDAGEAQVYVTGSVTLDGPELTELRARRGDPLVVAAIVHELGHLVGLDHVDDPSQLMAARTSRVTALQQGDLAGLNRLGTGRCVTEL